LNGRPTNEKEDRMALRNWILTGALVLMAAPVLAGGGAFGQQFAADRAALFAQADADGDGALSPAEYQTFMQLVKQKMLEHRFAKLDANGDGKVTLAEMEAAPHWRHGHGGCQQGSQPPATQ
jgi:EF hand domain-containing protein